MEQQTFRAEDTGKLTPENFPTLWEWTQLAPPEFKERINILSTRARQEPSVVMQRAYQVLVQLLNEMYSKGGRKW